MNAPYIIKSHGIDSLPMDYEWDPKCHRKFANLLVTNNPEFEYSEDRAKPVLNAFLGTLDYENNPYLCSPKEMLGKGFRGEPYTIL